jgi:hypothetical protein
MLLTMNKTMSRLILIFSAFFVLSACTQTSPTDSAVATPEVTITYDEVNAAQQAWCEAVVALGQAYTNGEDYKALANEILTEAYEYDNGKVFFKPTLAYGERTFRDTKESAHSYFVGDNTGFPEDKGFALRPWVKSWYDNQGEGNEGIQIHGDIAITQGWVYFEDTDGNVTMVDKTFIFRKGDDGKLRLILHHSSLPFAPAS